MRIVTALAAGLFVSVMATGCAAQQAKTPSTPAVASTSATTYATATSTGGALAVAKDGEQADQAAKRLFPEVYGGLIDGGTEHPAVVRGAQVGHPVPLSQDYGMTRPVLAQWVLPDDLRSVSKDMFVLMRPTAMRHDAFVVPIVSGGKAVAEFDMDLDQAGHWQVRGYITDPLPGGQVHDLEAATSKLKSVLGPDARVRPVVFLPSGLEFAVGEGRGKQAAVYLTFVNHGQGVTSFDKYLPETGALYTPAELKALLTP
jgi:hypothetical protein